MEKAQIDAIAERLREAVAKNPPRMKRVETATSVIRSLKDTLTAMRKAGANWQELAAYLKEAGAPECTRHLIQKEFASGFGTRKARKPRPKTSAPEAARSENQAGLVAQDRANQDGLAENVLAFQEGLVH